MGKYKDNARYNVVSIRISDEEKLMLAKMMQRRSTTISRLMREAIRLYALQETTKAGQSS